MYQVNNHILMTTYKAHRILFQSLFSKRLQHHAASTPSVGACPVTHTSFAYSLSLPAIRFYRNRMFASTATATATTTMTSSSLLSDSHEVQKFTALSKSWWDPLENPLIHMNPIRIEYICQQIRLHIPRGNIKCSTSTRDDEEVESAPYIPPLQGLRILDVGCGGGLLSESLAMLGGTVHGIDPSHALVEVARSHAASRAEQKDLDLRYSPGLTVQQLATAQKNATNNETNLFDVICCLEVVEHVPDPRDLLAAAGVLLKPDTGLLFVSTVNRTAASLALTIIGAEYALGYLPVGTHDWRRYLSHTELEAMLPTNVNKVHVSGMTLESLPAVITKNEWNWKLDVHNTNINWIGCYRKQGKYSTEDPNSAAMKTLV